MVKFRTVVRLNLFWLYYVGLRETERLIQETGARVFADICDVSKQENIHEAAEKAREKVGEVTILVNNAG